GRRAANTFEACFFVVSPSDYDALLGEIDRAGGPTAAFRLELARKAFAHTGGYDTAIAATLAAVSVADAGFVRTADGAYPPTLALALRKVCDLRYGENPHQA